MVSLRRGDVIQALENALPKGTIHTNHTFERFVQNENGVQVYFSDGSMVEGDILIGADGIFFPFIFLFVS